jgi:hypothetical protein
MRKSIAATLATLAVAAPAHADGGEPGEEAKAKEKSRVVRIAGPIVRLTESSIVVENRVGDATLACLLPEGKARRVGAAFEVGDVVRMHCLRQRGKRAILLAVKPFEARGDENEKEKEKKEKAQEKAEGPAPVKSIAAGVVAELGDGAIVVKTREGRVACRVPADKRAKLAGLQVGDAVKLLCSDGALAGLERLAPPDAAKPAPKPHSEEVRLYGRITALSRESVTVRGEAESLTCRVPAASADKVGRFALGNAVKLICRGGEVAYLELTS